MKNQKLFRLVWPVIGCLLLLFLIIGMVTLRFFPFSVFMNLVLIITGLILSAMHYFHTKRPLAFALIGSALCILIFAIVLLVIVLTAL